MYKIYINETPLYLDTDNSKEAPIHPTDKESLQLSYEGKTKLLLHVIDRLEKTDHLAFVRIFCNDLQTLWSDFVSLFNPIEAAGGLVINEEGKQLFIFRRGFWDLPKGKIDPGETPAKTAVREVMEETGLQNLTIQKQLIDTYHTYKLKNKRILKRTFWYLMKTTDSKLILQTEEDIMDAKWVERGKEDGLGKIYGNIRDVIAAAHSDAST